MRIPVLLAFCLLLAGLSAQHSTPAAGAKTIACAVMPTYKVDIAAATKKHMYADYKGNRYFFCCGTCPKQFKKNPEKYINGAHIKTPEATN